MPTVENTGTQCTLCLCGLIFLSPQYNSVLLRAQPFSNVRQFCDKCTARPQIDTERCKVKGTLYMLLVSLSPKGLFRPTTSRFRHTKLPKKKIANASNNLRINLNT